MVQAYLPGIFPRQFPVRGKETANNIHHYNLLTMHNTEQEDMNKALKTGLSLSPPQKRSLLSGVGGSLSKSRSILNYTVSLYILMYFSFWFGGRGGNLKSEVYYIIQNRGI